MSSSLAKAGGLAAAPFYAGAAVTSDHIHVLPGFRARRVGVRLCTRVLESGGARLNGRGAFRVTPLGTINFVV
ncbi:MAG TPA: hypothetical protein VGC80_14650, partial [Acetobacteraceae bacterium]